MCPCYVVGLDRRLGLRYEKFPPVAVTIAGQDSIFFKFMSREIAIG